ncbi:MAG: fibrillarin-like rRNA/tRNA 2'-O-methyltransferase, partial [Ferroplasma sp.]
VYSLSQYNNSVYGEKIKAYNGTYLREWNPKRSKLGAAILKGFNNIPFNEKSNVVYLGASTGTTVSHVSDLCFKGKIFAVEFSYDSFVKLYSLARIRNNIFPILEDANLPEQYSFFAENPDIIYQDIAQRNQVEIFNKNSEIFTSARKAILIIKIRAISSSRSDEHILKASLKKINGFKIINIIDLKPYDIGNYFVYMER